MLFIDSSLSILRTYCLKLRKLIDFFQILLFLKALDDGEYDTIIFVATRLKRAELYSEVSSKGKNKTYFTTFVELKTRFYVTMKKEKNQYRPLKEYLILSH